MNKSKISVIALALAVLGSMAVLPRVQAADTDSAYEKGRQAGQRAGRQAAQDDRPAEEEDSGSQQGGCCGGGGGSGG